MLVDVDADARRAAEPRRELHRGRPLRRPERLVEDGLIATTDYDELRDADAILIACRRRSRRQREPDLSTSCSARRARSRRGCGRASSSCSSRRPTRARPARICGRSSRRQRADGRQRLLPGLLARARRPGQRDWTTKNIPKVVGGVTDGVHARRRRRSTAAQSTPSTASPRRRRPR